MTTSSNGNLFRVTGLLCGEFTGPRWISLHKGQWRGALMFFFICDWINDWVNNREAGDLRRYRVHYDVIVMLRTLTGYHNNMVSGHVSGIHLPQWHFWMLGSHSRSTVYPKKYAHGFCFAVLCCGYTLTDFPISIRLTSLALWQSNDYPSAGKATLMNMDKYFMWIHYER